MKKSSNDQLLNTKLLQVFTMLIRSIFSIIIIALILSSTNASADIWDDIRSAALAPNNGPNGRALPLAGAWENGWGKYQDGKDQDGEYKTGVFFEPSYLIQQIEKQHHLLINIIHLEQFSYVGAERYSDYMEEALNYLEQKSQPILVGGTQYEQILYKYEPYISMPPSASPRVYTTSQELLNQITPFPPELSYWHDVGTHWTSGSSGMNMLQSIYPNPPRVIFLGNNEAERVMWINAETDQRYINLYGTGQTDNFKRCKFAEGWTACYREMFDGMRAGLSTNWRNNAMFVGYMNGRGTPWNCFGRWSAWPGFSFHYDNHISWEQNAWDGGSISYYPQNSGTNSVTDFNVNSLQVAAQNMVFMMEDQLADNPDFWLEISSHDNLYHLDWLINTMGQTYNSARYKGMVQFAAFLLTPRVVRHYSATPPYVAERLEYFNALVEIVDRVHTDPMLKKFWQYGALVENTSRVHPYQTGIPAEFADRSRWFQLNTSLDPAAPWTLTTEIPVFALARVIGTTPNREWLLFAQSPLQERSNVVITVPGYGDVTTDVSREGTFVHVKENNNDLMAYYSLNDTVNDLSGNGNNGTLVNNPGYAAAKINNGISLIRSASQYINCGRATSLNGSDEMTISAWVKANSLEAAGYNWILGKGSLTGAPRTGYSLRCLNGQLKYYVAGPNDALVSVTGPTLAAGVWYHITMVFKGGQYLKLIVNDVTYTNSTNIPSSIAASSGYDLHIGNGSYCTYPWNGLIDEVKIFNRALSEQEITDEAYRLVHLDFEKITSGTVADLSRNSNIGTLVNSPTLTRTRTVGNNGIQLVKSNSQYVNCVRNASLNGTDELTVDTWARADTLQDNGSDWILGKGNSQSGYSLMCLNKSLNFYVVGGQNNTMVSVTGPTLEKDVWYHIIAVYKGGQYLKLIVNGVTYTNSTDIPSTITASNDYDLQIGAGSYCGYYWDGVIDEVKIYNKAIE